MTESANKDTFILFLWVNSDCIVLGRNQNLLKECDYEKATADGIAIARRKTGGGCVFHDQANLNFSFICDEKIYDREKQFEVIIRAARSLGIELHVSGRNDLEFSNGNKCSGNAFLQRGSVCLHHGTLLLRVDEEKMHRYLTPSESKLKSKGLASVAKRVEGMSDYNSDISIEALISEIENSASRIYGQPIEQSEISVNERINELLAQYQSGEWIWGRYEKSNWQSEAVFAWGEIRIELAVNQFFIESCNIYTDALDSEIFIAIKNKLEGEKFDKLHIEKLIWELTDLHPNKKIILEDIISLFE